MKRLFEIVLFCLIAFFVVSGTMAQDKRHAVIYVSSSEGVDENDGLTPESPVKTIRVGVDRGTTVLLKAGDCFYESLYATDRKIGRYGEGHNPTLLGFKRIIEPRWEQVDTNIWRLNLSEDNFTGYNEVGPSLLNNIGCIHEYDKDVIHGCRRQYLKDLKRNWDFWQTEHHERQINPREFSFIYLYLQNDPNTLKIEFSVGEIAARIVRTSIDHINFIGFGYGIECRTRTIVRNCRIDIMGGREWLGQDVFCSLGNGIGYYVNQDMEDCIIEGNYITRCYDCGITVQAYGCGKATPRNFTIQDNLIMNCCQGWEDFLRNDPEVVYENCIFRNNFVLDSGDSGFSYPEERFTYCHILGYNNAGDKGMIFENNVFAKGNFFCGNHYKNKYRSNIMIGNKCFISPGYHLISHFSGNRDVIRMKGSIEESENELAQYRDLTNDYTTEFVVLSEREMSVLVENLQEEYLKTHYY